LYAPRSEKPVIPKTFVMTGRDVLMT